MSSLFSTGRRVVVPVTATTIRLTRQNEGNIITNRGAAGNLAVTLPPTADLPVGWACEFFSVAAGTFTIAAAVASTMVVFNNGTASSIAFSTAAEIIGNSIQVIWDGTGWLTKVGLGAETVTPTIA